MSDTSDLQKVVADIHRLSEAAPGQAWRDVPFLLSAVEDVLALHVSTTPSMWDAPFCQGCGFDWPCPTASAIQGALGGRGQFTSEPDPLPTEPGWYMRTSEMTGESRPTLYYLSDHGDWYQAYGHVTCSLLEVTVAELHARDRLVHIRLGVAS